MSDTIYTANMLPLQGTPKSIEKVSTLVDIAVYASAGFQVAVARSGPCDPALCDTGVGGCADPPGTSCDHPLGLPNLFYQWQAVAAAYFNVYDLISSMQEMPPDDASFNTLWTQRMGELLEANDLADAAYAAEGIQLDTIAVTIQRSSTSSGGGSGTTTPITRTSINPFPTGMSTMTKGAIALGIVAVLGVAAYLHWRR